MTDIKLTKEMIDKIFAEAKQQYEYLINLYKVAYPNWEEIKKLHGFPKVSKETGFYLMQKAIEWDDAHEMYGESGLPVMSGGLWMNSGFSSNEDLKDWIIDISETTVELKNGD